MSFPIALLRGLIGLAVFIGIAAAFSSNRKAIDWKLVLSGVGLQVVFALLVLKTGPGELLFDAIATGFRDLLSFTYEGTKFIFGELGNPQMGNNFAFQVLPTIIFFASLMSVLYFLGIVQPLVKGMGWLMQKTLGISGAESLSAAANVFIGQTEAPLVVEPYVEKMTRSELMTLMSGGMATIAGGVLAAYISFLGGETEAEQVLFAKHLLSASIMSAPAAIVTAKILVPETEEPETRGATDMNVEKEDDNVIEAAATGAGEGLKLALNVGAMLLAFIALIAVINWVLGGFGNITGLNEMIANASGGRFEGLTLEAVFGFIFAPLAWAMGVEAADILSFGTLLGEKVAVNEFVAYASLQDLKDVMSRRSVIIGTYALCGFANFSSIAIQIGGIGGIAPSRRSEIAALGLRAVLGGALASWMTATIAGVLVA
ncbi:NupC/NupG family nucleoside CNT transporter [Longibacter salinarum]|uniref:NupC/NupG family nucleoside CNT transporter n=1 Tax=Longibacter salinarum TaxID=1850348 RepID=A0A2A8CZT6_9BACT|nr:nucleoside transporter C-terminal domain-containing protein [Longibacter salinarum]PEN14195.1 NupC/NupG family nucleoside CNT transporter [Longibacter salinarum]